MLLFKFFFTLSLYVIIVTRAGLIQDKLFEGVVLHHDRLDAQCRGKNVPIRSYIHGIKTTSTKIFVGNCTMVAKEGGFKKLMMTIIINRCRSKENLDTCEEYWKQTNIDYCKAIDPGNPITKESPFYVPFEPRLKCPLVKGVYHAYNFTMDLAPLIFFKLEGWYWKIKNEVVSVEENKLISCMNMEGYVTSSKFKS